MAPVILVGIVVSALRRRLMGPGFKSMHIIYGLRHPPSSIIPGASVARFSQECTKMGSKSQITNSKLTPEKFLPLNIDIRGLEKYEEDSFWLEEMRQSEITQFYAVMKQAAEMGDNVGVDEYVNENQFHERLRLAKCIALKSHRGTKPDSERLLAAVIVGPCRLARGVRTCLCELQIFLSHQVNMPRADILSQLVSLCEGIAISLDVGYTGCVIQVAESCSDWLIQLRKLDYVITACLPRTVEIKGEGLIDNFVLYKRLSGAEHQRTLTEMDFSTQPEVTSIHVTGEQERQLVAKEIPGLPTELGPFILRASRPDEDQVIFDTLSFFAKRGMGYSVAEYPTLAYLRKKVLRHGHGVVYQDKDTGEVAQFFIILPSSYLRNNKGTVCGGVMFKKPSYTKEKLFIYRGHEILFTLMHNLGYERTLGTFVAGQYPIIMKNRISTMVKVGSLPDGIYITGQGWQDLLFVYRDSLADIAIKMSMSVI